MVKKAIQAASARDASSLSTTGIEISDIDAEFGDTDPLTLLERFKVCVLFSTSIFVIICIEMTRLFFAFYRRHTATFFTIMSEISSIE